MAGRYKVVGGSQSAHCCFDATVVDTTVKFNLYRDTTHPLDGNAECASIRFRTNPLTRNRRLKNDRVGNSNHA